MTPHHLKQTTRSVTSLGLAAVLLVTGGQLAQASQRPQTAGPGVIVAAARPGTPKPVAVAGSRMITVDWGAKKYATKYYVQFSTDRNFKKGTKKATVKSSFFRTRSVTNRKTYYVRVKASSGRLASGWSKKLKVRPSTDSPGPKVAGVKAKPAGYQKVKISWQRNKLAQQYWIDGAASAPLLSASISKNGRFRTKKLPATATSYTFAIPSAFRSRVGANSGNPLFFRVYVKNGTKIRKSVIKIVLPGAKDRSGKTANRLNFATYNVLSMPASAKMSGHTWADRRQKVANAIKYAKADVVAIQEAVTSKYKGRSQYRDVEHLVAGSGLRLAYSDAVVGRVASGQDKSSHLLYRPSKLTVRSAGIQSVRKLNTSTSTPSDRMFAWAKLRVKATGQEFYVASVHLQSGNTDKAAAIRNGVIKGVESFMRKKASGLPVVLMGDFNSDVWARPFGPQTIMVDRGWRNAAATQARYKTQYASTNRGGFPAKPYKNELGLVGARIDNIFLYNVARPNSFTNQVILRSGGRFNTTYQGSDHNLQRSVITLR